MKRVALAGLLLLGGCALDVWSQVLDSGQLEEALASKPRTRGIKLQAKTESRGAVSLDIPFELNSSALAPQARQQLGQLEQALRSPALNAYRFLIAGHTDASGDAQHNRRLSMQRAETVKQYLVDAGIDAQRLECVGYGEDRLLTTDRPNDAVNRRVEIRNLDDPAP